MIDWNSVRRVLVIRLRSIGDTVLATPSLIALKRFLPAAQIDILLEDWVTPLLGNFDAVDNVISISSGGGGRLKAARQIRRNKYDVVFNLHGGTTSTFLSRATDAPHRVGFADYQYSFLLNHRVPPATEFWQADHTHSAEQQLALLGYLGVPVDDRPKSRLVVSDAALASIESRLSSLVTRHSSLALLHPSTAFFTKQWPVGNFARVAEFLAEKGIASVAIASTDESQVLGELEAASKAPVVTFDDLTLPEITALASKAALFVGNDSGIAHIAAAVDTPSVVIFGSSNRNHWRPWTDAPNEIVFEPFPCQPCPGYECKEFGEPKCILTVRPESVFAAIDRVLRASKLSVDQCIERDSLR
jgi:lipopolysaccharide heptosyltransferase II